MNECIYIVQKLNFMEAKIYVAFPFPYLEQH